MPPPPGQPHLDVEQARRRTRVRRVVATAGVSLVARAGSILALVLTVPLALDHLGPERFGMWMVLSTLASLMLYADFGIGNGVLNKVATASAGDDRDSVHRAASNGFFLLAALGAVIALMAVAGHRAIPWPEVFQVDDTLARAEAGPAALALLLVLAITIPATIASKVQLGLQQGYAPQAWLGIGSVLSLVTTVLAIRLGGGVPALVIAFFGSQALAYVGNCLHFFGRQRPDLRPAVRLVDSRTARTLLSLGAGFFLLQLIGLVTFRADTIIVTQFFGSEQAGYYAIAERLFALAAMVVAIALSPLWPAYGEAAGRGDRQWLAQTLVRSTVFAVAVTAVICAVLVVANPLIVELWLGRSIVFPVFLLAGFAVWRILEAAGVAIALFMNGVGAVRSQVILAAAMGAVATALKIVLVPTWGMAWINWLTSGAYLLLFLVPATLLLPRLLRRVGGSASPEPDDTAPTPNGPMTTDRRSM